MADYKNLNTPIVEEKNSYNVPSGINNNNNVLIGNNIPSNNYQLNNNIQQNPNAYVNQNLNYQINNPNYYPNNYIKQPNVIYNQNTILYPGQSQYHFQNNNIVLPNPSFTIQTGCCKVLQLITAIILIIYLVFEFIALLSYKVLFKSVLITIDELGIIAIIVLFICSYCKGNNDLRVASVITTFLVWIIGFFMRIINNAVYEDGFDDLIFFIPIRAFLITLCIPVAFL